MDEFLDEATATLGQPLRDVDIQPINRTRVFYLCKTAISWTDGWSQRPMLLIANRPPSFSFLSSLSSFVRARANAPVERRQERNKREQEGTRKEEKSNELAEAILWNPAILSGVFGDDICSDQSIWSPWQPVSLACPPPSSKVWKAGRRPNEWTNGLGGAVLMADGSRQLAFREGWTLPPDILSFPRIFAFFYQFNERKSIYV